MTFYAYQIKRGTASEWTSANPVLLAGEVGLESDTNKMKVGNGATAWNGLAYLNADKQPLDADLTALAALSSTGLAERTGAGTWTTDPVTAYSKTLLDDADAATARTTLGGTAAGQSMFTAASAAAQADLLISARDWRGRNSIINGGFSTWQRGTSFAAAATSNRYLADRWAQGSAGTTVAVDRVAFTLGQTSVPGEPAYYLAGTIASVAGAANYAVLRQRVEGVRSFAGQTATLSFYALATPAAPLSVELAQSFGTGGSPSAMVTGIGVTKVNVTTAWQRFTVTVALPSIAGKTIGSIGDDYLDVIFWLDAGSSFDARTSSLGQRSGVFQLSQVQFETGSVVTPFEQRHIGTEMTMAQRYYQAIGGLSAYFYSTFAGVWEIPTITFPRMRTTPTFTFGSPAYSNCSALAVASPYANALRPSVTVTAVGGTSVIFGLTMDAEL